MKRTFFLFLAIISFGFAIHAYSEDVTKFTNDDLQRYNSKKAWADVHQAHKLGGKVDQKVLQALKRASGREK